jgi:zinc/manganese transport system permease protein
MPGHLQKILYTAEAIAEGGREGHARSLDGRLVVYLSAPEAIVAIVAGVVGYFVVLRGAAFPAHAIPKGAFAGAAGAALLGINTLIGLAVFSLLGALAIGTLGRRGRQDVVTALALVLMLALGAAFLSLTTQYEPEIYSLLFGQILGVSTTQILPIAALGAVCIAAIAILYRPFMLSSIVPEIAETNGIRSYRIQIAFLIVVALATTMTVPVTGALLIFSLMIGPPAAARSFTSRPLLAMALSVAIALVTVWAAIAASYLVNWPIGFFVGTLAALSYGTGRGWATWRRTHTGPRPATALPRQPATDHT